MRLFRRFARGELKLGRIEAFSDGVFAIIVTLLVLELKIPQLSDPGNVVQLKHELLELMPKFLSWLVSFIIVCKFWLNHHHVLSLARHADYALIWMNSVFLMFQSFIPFPTALMGEYPSNSLAVSFFGIVMAVNTVAFMVLHSYVLRSLIKPELAAQQDPHIMRKSWIGPLCYLAGACAAWANVHVAFAAYMITPLFFITPPTRAK